jgi:hypothetical protein
MKYPLALCLSPAVNLLLFSPAITDLIEKFGKFRRLDNPQVQPLEPIPQPQEEIPRQPIEPDAPAQPPVAAEGADA